MKVASMAAYSGEYCEIKSVSLRDYPVTSELLRLIPERIARKFQVLPLVQLGDTLTMAVAEPVDFRLLKMIRRNIHLQVNPLFCPRDDVKDAIQYFYSASRLYFKKRNRQYFETNLETGDFSVSVNNPVEKWIIQLLYDAIEKRCTQIIFECTVSYSKVYLKSFGRQEEFEFPTTLPANSILEYFKLIINQPDSRQTFWEQQIKIDFDETPVSIYFAGICSAENIIVTLKIHYYGELSSPQSLGLNAEQNNTLNEIFSQPSGVLFISASSELGKTTTLNAFANYMSENQRRVIHLSQSIEIPNDRIIQIALPTWNQIDANTFWNLIKQQKPCVLLIDDFYSRDVLKQVLELASDDIFVIFTLPFQDLQQLFAFFQTQKINFIPQQQYYLLRQYQVRQLCDHCKEIVAPDFEKPSPFIFQRGNGCPHCHNTGFQGISGIFEINMLNQRQSLTQRKYPEYFTKIISGQPTLFQAGMQKVESGEIEIEEIMQLR